MKKQLIIPMYRLNTTKSIEEIDFDNQDVVFFRRDYNLEERQKQYEALEWAMDNPDYDFKSISPIFKNLKFSNYEILSYFKKIYHFMKANKLDIE